MVKKRNQLSIARLPSLSAQCAIVTVTPEDSSSAVFSAGMPQAPIGVKGSSKPGPAEGQWLVKPGHREGLWSRLGRAGTEITRGQNRAPKKPAKNNTSEKMEQHNPPPDDKASPPPHMPAP